MTFSPLSLALLGWLVVALMMAALWLFQRATKDAGVVDVGWAAGLGLLGVAFAALGPGDPGRRLLLAVMAGGWSLRLAGYLLVNRVLGKAEDGRYAALRASWGKRAPFYFFLFFQAQAALDVLLALPFLAVAAGAGPLRLPDAAGALLWVLAVSGEAAADRQLAAFRGDPANRGATCRRGLWRFSRHPNYFFEWLHWFAYPLLAAGSPLWWLTLVGPAVMTLFLWKVTGIPATEAQALKSRPDYAEYRRTTSAFVPWFPKKP